MEGVREKLAVKGAGTSTASGSLNPGMMNDCCLRDYFERNVSEWKCWQETQSEGHVSEGRVQETESKEHVSEG